MHPDHHESRYMVGLDVGSTTVKAIVVDRETDKMLWSDYQRHETKQPEKVFEFEDPDVRIDYPVWSPDGKWVLFDRFRPQGGDIWIMENIE